ncbi:MAG: calcium/sodium antiporter [Lachnospiraceae bacterium]|nr:calcium/sodium antiporter [Lachnospiraceae bacterium]
MQIVANCFILIVGFVALIKGADYFVDGSAAIARFFKVPGVIIGLTIVAMGTSAPELAVSVSAGLSGSNAIAVSNVVGSNIFNLMAVLGVCAILKPLPVDTGIKKRDFPISLAATFFVILLSANLVLAGKSTDIKNGSAMAGELFRWNGLVLLAAFILYMLYTIRMAKKNRVEEEASEPVVLWKSILFIVLGLVAIIIGGQLVVNSARALALAWGMSETLVGLTIVAIGTSLPELVTSVVASSKGENGMAIGNVVGSNIFNLLLILGTSSSLHPIQISMASFVDLGILLGVSLVAYGFVCSGKRVNRVEGFIMTALYIGYTVFAILR